MEALKQLLEECLGRQEMILAATASNPRTKEAAAPTKIKIRPLKLKKGLVYQAECLIGTKAYHENLEPETLPEYICSQMQQFRQLALETQTLHITVLVSKKGKPTITTKRKQSADTLSQEALSHNKKKQYVLPEQEPVPFLVDLGVQTAEGKIVKAKYDKFRQINRYLEFVRDIVPSLPKNRTLTIIDFGCGKSYLTFALYYYLKIMLQYDIRVIGLDLKEDVIATCNELSRRYGYEDNLKFYVGDISTYEGVEQVDMVVTLHACDTATDHALQKAVKWNASVILSVPCCQHEMNRQIRCEALESVLQYGLIKERMSALLTDAIRANLLEEYGYDTQILEFIDMEHTPKNILIRAVRRPDKPAIRHQAAKRGSQIEELETFLHVSPCLHTLLQELEPIK